MAAPGGANQIARCVIDDLIECSEETFVDGYMSFFKSQQFAESRGFINRMREEANTVRNLVGQLNTLIAKMEALEDQGELFDTLMDLRADSEAAFEVDPMTIGRNELLEKIIGCVVDSGGVPELDPKVSDIWGLFGIA
ncbi:hypothetical protein Tco_1026592 [Tanacetum coccineum]